MLAIVALDRDGTECAPRKDGDSDGGRFASVLQDASLRAGRGSWAAGTKSGRWTWDLQSSVNFQAGRGMSFFGPLVAR